MAQNNKSIKHENGSDILDNIEKRKKRKLEVFRDTIYI